jgi:hypothetical protein
MQPFRSSPWTRRLSWLAIPVGIALAAAYFMPRPDLLAPLNDVTTDLANPPEFFVAPPERPGYDAARFAPLQRRIHGDLSNARLPWPPQETLARAERLARGSGWTLVGVDAAGLRLQAIAVTRLLRFRDDVVIAVRPAESGGSIVAMRSKSRLGRSDLGTNARRIRAFLAALAAGE